jgi:hypothetical protein
MAIAKRSNSAFTSPTTPVTSGLANIDTNISSIGSGGGQNFGQNRGRGDFAYADTGITDEPVFDEQFQEEDDLPESPLSSTPDNSYRKAFSINLYEGDTTPAQIKEIEEKNTVINSKKNSMSVNQLDTNFPTYSSASSITPQSVLDLAQAEKALYSSLGPNASDAVQKIPGGADYYAIQQIKPPTIPDGYKVTASSMPLTNDPAFNDSKNTTQYNTQGFSTGAMYVSAKNQAEADIIQKIYNQQAQTKIENAAQKKISQQLRDPTQASLGQNSEWIYPDLGKTVNDFMQNPTVQSYIQKETKDRITASVKQSEANLFKAAGFTKTRPNTGIPDYMKNAKTTADRMKLMADNAAKMYGNFGKPTKGFIPTGGTLTTKKGKNYDRPIIFQDLMNLNIQNSSIKSKDALRKLFDPNTPF